MKALRRIRAQRLAEAAGVVFIDFDEVRDAVRRSNGRLATEEEIREFWGS